MKYTINATVYQLVDNSDPAVSAENVNPKFATAPAPKTAASAEPVKVQAKKVGFSITAPGGKDAKYTGAKLKDEIVKWLELVNQTDVKLTVRGKDVDDSKPVDDYNMLFEATLPLVKKPDATTTTTAAPAPETTTTTSAPAPETTTTTEAPVVETTTVAPETTTTTDAPVVETTTTL